MNTSLTGISKRLKGVKYGSELRPARDWLALLTLAALFILASVGWNLWMFSKVTKGDAIGTEAPPPAGSSVNLNAVDALFTERSAERARYINEYRFVDPSGTSR